MQLNLYWKSLAVLALIQMVMAATVPTTQVQLDYYTYSNNVLSGRIYVQNIAYSKVVKVIYSDASGNWNNNGNTISASYVESISGTNYEYWDFSATIGTAGIKQFYLRYDVSGSTYYDNNGGDNNNYNVVATTSTTSSSTTTTTATTTTATKTTSTTSATATPTSSATFPSGNSTITTWAKSQKDISWKTLLTSLNPSGTAKGFIAASLSTSNPDYYYAWTRDSALVARTMVNMYNTTEAGSASVLGLLQDYVTFQINAMSTSTVCNCLGEPKFNPDGSSYTGAWGRPQNDGPAERASTFILFADSYIAQGGQLSYVTGTLAPAIYKDLNYVVSTWSNNCFDLWEEVNGRHMFTLAVMRRALLDGVNFASRIGDTTYSSTWSSTASSIQSTLSGYYLSSGNYITTVQNFQSGVSKAGYDVSTLIAANVAGMGDGFFTPGSDEVLATAVAIENKFSSLYGVNANKASYLGTAIGRYPEDTYNGYGNGQGNPWFIATAAYAELYYRAILEWQTKSSIVVNSKNLGFFSKFDSSAAVGTTYTPGTTAYSNMVQNVALAADRFLSTVQLHAATNGSMSEQFNRDTGVMQGARDLTWSHSAFITAARAKLGSPVY
ncbi:glucoamylase A precursor [Syncephalastrum racemosum]|uniref:glucan 1,4-alpha-glucosidase n=1 Tax=Syncephalastrum racemosum TaxID=13706 RepID=A0A1X2HEV7_SYNRA|nr:glucoamylase A precursor [Syncephalastrum racemosum]